MEGALAALLFVVVFVYLANSEGEISQPWCMTGLQAENINFGWIVRNYSLRSEQRGEALTSPSFYDLREETRWNILLYPRGRKDSNEDQVGIFLCLRYSEIRLERATFNVTLHHIEGEDVEKNMRRLFPFASTECWGWPNFISRSRIVNEFLINNSLRIEVKVERVEEKSICPQNKQEHEHRNEISEDCVHSGSRLHEEFNIHKDFVDYEFQVSGEVFLVHKVIIWVRNPLFYEIMASSPEDLTFADDNGTVIAPIAFQQFLEFLYSGILPPLTKMHSGLLVLASKYEADLLMTSLDDLLLNNLQVDSAARCLSLASRFDLPRLQEAIWNFLDSNLEDIMATSSWKNLLQKDASLASLVFQRLMGDKQHGSNYPKFPFHNISSYIEDK